MSKPKPEPAVPKLHRPPSRAALEAQQEAAQRRLQDLDAWTEGAAVRPGGPAKPPQAKPQALATPAADASLQERLYAIPIEAEHSLFVRIPKRLFRMLEEVEHDRRHKSMRELVEHTLMALAEQHVGVRLYREGEQPPP